MKDRGRGTARTQASVYTEDPAFRGRRPARGMRLGALLGRAGLWPTV